MKKPAASASPTPSPVQALVPTSNFSSLVASTQDLGLTPEETKELEAYQKSLAILGPAAGAVLCCPGNQENIDEQDQCPYAAKCPLLRMKKAPAGKLCPIEMGIIEERFGAWCTTIGKGEGITALDESDRVAVSDLVWIELQIERCQHILARGNAARLTVINPKDVHPETLEPVSWEQVIHPNVELLVQLQASRIKILKDWMLTPEQRWKIEKAAGRGSGKDVASQQSARADKLRRINGPVLEQ